MNANQNPLLTTLKHYFNLQEDSLSAQQTIENIEKGIEFRGTNLWVLIFAIFIASIGLNMNSTAVIIGAMLISPLMGPIMGIGLGVGIVDFALIKKAAFNLGVATLISILTSTLYFFISPLQEAQSELLARTTPAIWDVLIAFFGGLAGVIAATRKEKSNAIPGVAIATALMPPLCTAGYGLANGNWYMFLGAFYLFFINSVFISLSTILIVRFLNYPKKTFVDQTIQRRVSRYLWITIICTLVPSIYLAYGIVKRSVFEQNAKQFVEKEMKFDKSQIVRQNINAKAQTIELFILGEPISESQITQAKDKLSDYKLNGCQLLVRQGVAQVQQMDMQQVREGIIETIYEKNENLIKNKDSLITLLQKELIHYKVLGTGGSDIFQEIKAEHPSVSELALSQTLVYYTTNQTIDTVLLAYVRHKKRPARGETKRLENWLKVRLKAKKIKIVTQ